MQVSGSPHAAAAHGWKSNRGRSTMIRFKQVASVAAVAVAALLIAAAPAAAQDRLRSVETAQAKPPGEKKPHRLVLQVNTNDAAMMNLALNNAANVVQYYKELGEKVEIEVVTFGPEL